MPMIRAVLFDMDGVMVNTETFYIKALIDTLSEEIGLKLTEKEVEKYAGLIYTEKLKRIFEERKVKADPYELAEKSRRKFLCMVRGRIKLLPGVRELIEGLFSYGIKLALVSSSRKNVVEMVIRETGLKGVFDAIVTQEDVKHLKPHPEPYLLASKMLKIRPEECVVIEDSVHGISSAKSAGMKCIAIVNPNLPISNYSEADMLVRSVREIKLEDILNL